MSDVTCILECAEAGHPSAAGELLPLVDAELRRLAPHTMANEAAGHPLPPTALVHEAWLRWVGKQNQQGNGRAHFFRAAVEAMRRIVVENGRRKRAARPGGGQAKLELQDIELAAPAPEDELLAVNDALEKLAVRDNKKAELVKLRHNRRPHDTGGHRGAWHFRPNG